MVWCSHLSSEFLCDAFHAVDSAAGVVRRGFHGVNSAAAVARGGSHTAESAVAVVCEGLHAVARDAAVVREALIPGHLREEDNLQGRGLTL